MPKRKRSITKDFECLRKKMKKLEQELDKSRRGRRKIRVIDSSSSSSAPSSRESSPSPQHSQGEDDQYARTPEGSASNDQDLLSQDHGEGSLEATADLTITAAGSSTAVAITTQDNSTGEVLENSRDPATCDDALDSLIRYLRRRPFSRYRIWP